MKNTGSQYLKTAQIAKMFNISGNVVVKWILKGILPAIKTPGGHYRILAGDADKLQMALEVKPEIKLEV